MDGQDFDAIYAIFTDANVLRAFSLESFSKEQMNAWIDRNLGHQRTYGYGLFSVVLKATGELIGDCGLEHSDFRGTPCVELGYDFLSRHWNRGFATEAAQRIRDYSTEELGIKREAICSFIRQTNAASQRVSDKIGMHRILEFEKYGVPYFLYGFGDALP
jgi:RimJ/RimL family protein N-acetyltransferase